MDRISRGALSLTLALSLSACASSEQCRAREMVAAMRETPPLVFPSTGPAVEGLAFGAPMTAARAWCSEHHFAWQEQGPLAHCDASGTKDRFFRWIDGVTILSCGGEVCALVFRVVPWRLTPIERFLQLTRALDERYDRYAPLEPIPEECKGKVLKCAEQGKMDLHLQWKMSQGHAITLVLGLDAHDRLSSSLEQDMHLFIGYLEPRRVALAHDAAAASDPAAGCQGPLGELFPCSSR